MQRRLHGGGVEPLSATDKAYKRARRFRRQLSLPELLLWTRLKGSDLHLRKQHPIGDYILDFYCASAKLAIEVDGFAHETGYRPVRDEVRTARLNEEAIDVLRIPAKDILADPDSVADALIRLCMDRAKPLHQPAAPAGPPPQPSAREEL
jgi:very-short-patch-repair endonuclease